MWSIKIGTILACISCIACEQAKYCDHRYEAPEWFGSGSPSVPAEVNMGLVPTIRNAIMVQVKERKENVTLSLFALPYVESQNDCLSAKQVYSDLRKFHLDYTIIAGEDETKHKYFGGIFTGCYYAELTNSKGKKWIWAGVFYKTTYHYYDTTLNCRNNIKGALGDGPRSLTYNLELGLTCLQIRCHLFELNTTDHTINSSGDCMVTYIDIGWPARVNSKSKHKSLDLVSENVVSNGREGWSTVVKWRNLRKNGVFYYSKFERYNNSCDMSYSDLMVWDSGGSIRWDIFEDQKT